MAPSISTGKRRTETGTAEQLTDDDNNQWPNSFSPDGRHLVFGEQAPDTGADLMMLTLEDGKVTPLLVTEYTERNAEILVSSSELGLGCDVSADAERFLTALPLDDETEIRIDVVLNWFQELNRLVPTP